MKIEIRVTKERKNGTSKDGARLMTLKRLS